MRVRFFVEIDCPEEYYSEEKYTNTLKFISESIKELAEGLEGEVYDIEYK
jgi:hypothetical protein